MNLSFNPQDEDEVFKVNKMLKAHDYSSTLHEIYELCKRQLKHSDCENAQELVDLIEQIKALASEFE